MKKDFVEQLDLFETNPNEGINENFKEVMRERYLTKEEANALTYNNIIEAISYWPSTIFDLDIKKVSIDLIDLALNKENYLYMSVISNKRFQRKFTIKTLKNRFSHYRRD